MQSGSTVLESRHERLEQACGRLRERLSSGQDCRAEEVQAEFPDLASDDECAVRLVCTEFALRLQLGQQPNPVQWYERFPQWRRALESHFNSAKTVDGNSHVSASTVPSLPAEGGTAPPRRLGRYEVFEEVGHGAMGVVYRARDTALNRIVALKTIRAGVLATADDVERFRREARLAAQLDHPHIVRILDVGEQNGQNYFTMAFVAGGNLAERGDTFSEQLAAVRLLSKIARAAHYTHAKDIIHRDLKPGNVLLDEQSEPLINDFGLAKFLHADAEILTETGQVLGTPAYMAPEQAAGRINELGPRSDVWSLGVILYELLTGQRPFVGQAGADVKLLILTVDPVRPRTLAPNLHRDLETIILKCLEKAPDRRYASAEELADDLDRWLNNEPIEAVPESWARRGWRTLRRHRQLTLTSLLIGTAAALALILLKPSDRDDASEIPGSERPSLPQREKPEPPSPSQIAKEALLRNEQKLAAGESVELIGDKGRPAWHLVKSGDDNPNQQFGLDAEGCFAIASLNNSLVELMPDPQLERYRFRGWVRQTDKAINEDGMVGLYVNYVKIVEGTSHHHFYTPFGFLEPKTLWFNVRHHSDEPKSQVPHQFPIKRGILPKGPAGLWRELSVEVTPESVSAFLNNKLVVKADQALIHRHFDFLKKDVPNIAMPRHAPRQGIGLYVYRGTASFKSVVLEPLPQKIK